MTSVELHGRICYYISNSCFSTLCYVDNWHKDTAVPIYKTYNEFIIAFDKAFNAENLLNSVVFNDDTSESDTSESDYEEEYEHFEDLLKMFYPILHTVPSGYMGDDEPVRHIIDIIIPDFLNEQ